MLPGIAPVLPPDREKTGRAEPLIQRIGKGCGDPIEARLGGIIVERKNPHHMAVPACAGAGLGRDSRLRQCGESEEKDAGENDWRQAHDTGDYKVLRKRSLRTSYTNSDERNHGEVQTGPFASRKTSR